jgi:hypothetical protein
MIVKIRTAHAEQQEIREMMHSHDRDWPHRDLNIISDMLVHIM